MTGKNLPGQETAALMNQALGAQLHLFQFPNLLCMNSCSVGPLVRVRSGVPHAPTLSSLEVKKYRET